MALGSHLFDGFSQVVDGHQAAERGALSPWDNQPVKRIHVFWQPNFSGGHTQLAEDGYMFGEIALYR